MRSQSKLKKRLSKAAPSLSLSSPALSFCFFFLASCPFLVTSCGSSQKRVLSSEELRAEGRHKPLIIAIPKIGNLPAMARPVFLWLGAVKEKKPELLAQVFSSSARKEMAGLSWSSVLKRYHQLWQKRFGEWRVEDFHFLGSVRSGDQPNKGFVIVGYKPPGAKIAKRTQVPVVKEGEKWYVDRTFLKIRPQAKKDFP